MTKDVLFRVAPKTFGSQNTTHPHAFGANYLHSPTSHESADPLPVFMVSALA